MAAETACLTESADFFFFGQLSEVFIFPEAAAIQ